MIVSVDCVIFGFDQELSIFLIKRTNPYFKKKWSLPGSIVFENEALDSAAERTLYELSGLEDIYLDQVGAFGDPNRTKGARILTVAFMAIIDKRKHNLGPKVKNRTFISQINEEELILEGKWFKVSEMPALPQDHSKIAISALDFLKRKFRYEPIGLELLPEKFTLEELQLLFEAIYETKLDRDNFKKQILTIKPLEKLNEYQQNGSGKKIPLYAFKKEAFANKEDKGAVFDFEPKNN